MIRIQAARILLPSLCPNSAYYYYYLLVTQRRLTWGHVLVSIRANLFFARMMMCYSGMLNYFSIRACENEALFGHVICPNTCPNIAPFLHARILARIPL